MSNFNIPLRLPEFHADPVKYPKENWKNYIFNLELAYKVAGARNIGEEQKAAHLLQGLQGKARTFLELNPELKDKPLKEVEQALDTQFGGTRAQGLPDLNSIVQKPGESVSEFAARMKLAAMPMSEEKRSVKIMTEQEIKDKEIDRNVVKVWTPEEYAREQRIIREAADRFILPYFMKGMKESVRRAVVQRRPENFEDAIKIATEHERYDLMFGGGQNVEVNVVDAEASAISRVTSDEDIVNEAARHLKKLNKDNSAFAQNRQGSGEQQPAGAANRAQNHNCHYCGQVGHFQRQCPVKRYHELQSRQDHFLNGQRTGPFMQRGMRDMFQTGPRHPQHGAFGQPGKQNSNAQKQPMMSKNEERPPKGEGGPGKLPAPFSRQNQKQSNQKQNQ